MEPQIQIIQAKQYVLTERQCISYKIYDNNDTHTHTHCIFIQLANFSRVTPSQATPKLGQSVKVNSWELLWFW